ncbi:MAG: hypothetical protein V3R28_03350 [Desulfatiglandales bacterium]
MFLLPNIISLFAFANATPPSSEEVSFRSILAEQVGRYPKLELQDLYKLIYQAAMGSEHAVSDTDMVHTSLERELEALADGPAEPVIENISPDSRLVRINLRPYFAAKGDRLVLITAFVRTANEYKGSDSQLRRYWSYAERMAADGELPFRYAALERFFAQMKEQGFPAVHHSATYASAYHPAYRVIIYEFLGRS